jgi:hypothetical protein
MSLSVIRIYYSAPDTAMQYTVPFWARGGLGGAEPGIVTLSLPLLPFWVLLQSPLPYLNTAKLPNAILMSVLVMRLCGAAKLIMMVLLYPASIVR